MSMELKHVVAKHCVAASITRSGVKAGGENNGDTKQVTQRCSTILQ